MTIAGLAPRAKTRAMAARLTGALYTYRTHVLYVGPIVRSAPHRHHAGQVIWAPDGLLVADERCDERRVHTHVIAPETVHSHRDTAFGAMLWTDRDDARWNAAADVEGNAIHSLPSFEFGAPPTLDHAREIAEALLGLVSVQHAADTPRHPAVTRLCKLLDSTACNQDVRIVQLARQAGLSARQLRHRFTEDIGINPRAYRRWRRLRHAVAAVEEGATLTEAAVSAGFADGAHFSRVFHEQFGMTPSQALSRVRFGGSV